MNHEKMERMRNGKGFIAALDQSGGSTPKALEGYGISRNQYHGENEMFNLVHDMRTRIMSSPAFTSQHILGVILFEQTMDRDVETLPTVDYLWKKKGILSFLKVDQGLADLSDGVQMMKPISDLEGLLDRAMAKNIFGTKMRSVIKEANATGIQRIVEQQFELGKEIVGKGLIPILEPEVDINCPDKNQSESLLKAEILKHLNSLPATATIMLKLTIPNEPGFYGELMTHPRILRVVALSGGYTRDESVRLLKQNPGLIASFSRALVEGLTDQQPEDEFNQTLQDSIKSIYQASVT